MKYRVSVIRKEAALAHVEVEAPDANTAQVIVERKITGGSIDFPEATPYEIYVTGVVRLP